MHELVGGGFGGVDDLDAGGEDALDDGLQKRVVGAAENQCVGFHALGGGLGAEFVEVDADDFGCHGQLRWGRRGLRRKGFIRVEGAIQPSSTRGTSSGQAFSRARRPWAWHAAA